MAITAVQRREESKRAAQGRAAALQATEASLSLGLGGVGTDRDEDSFRRITTGAKYHTRDLSPLSHERHLEVVWNLFEMNPFGHRLITLMTDLVIGDGVQIQVKADDKRIQEVVDQFVSRNQFIPRLREFYIANSLNGELAFPVAVNPVTGGPVLGYLDGVQIRQVLPDPGNVLDLDTIVLKSIGGAAEQRLKIIRENPETGRLEGECFFHRVNALPNSTRGRSDLMPLADWLDLYDQFMFGEMDRLRLMSAFVYDYEIDTTDDKEVQRKLKALPKFNPGTVFGHNTKEKLEAKSPKLQAAERSDVTKMLRIHIAGNMGFPISYFGDVDSNRSTIEGQNDVMMKTPAARQKQFAGFIGTLIRFAIEQRIGKNPALFRDADPVFRITMPEIAAKDIARAGQVMASVASAMDTGLGNETMSKKLAIRVMAALVGHLGIEVKPEELAEQIEGEADERQAAADELQAAMSRQAALRGANPNPPGPGDPADDEDVDEPESPPADE